MSYKKILYLLLVLIALFTFTACNDENSDEATPITDSLQLTSDYNNRTFMSEGIGKVELLRVIDGDTIHFTEGNTTIKVRFMCVNTPESTGSIDPWGKAASDFTKEKIENAYEIVIEGEDRIGVAPSKDNTSSERYMGYVWYKPTANSNFRCLNVELVESCYSYYTNKSEKYDSYFSSAYDSVRNSLKKVFGEKDPNFSYDTEIKEISIATLKNNFSSYSTGNNLRLNVKIARLCGNSAYLVDIEDTIQDEVTLKKAGIYAYYSFKETFKGTNVGDIVTFECQASFSEEYGYQLVGPKNLRINSNGSEVVPLVIPSDVTSLEAYEGEVVKVENLKVTKVGRANDEGAYTVYCEMENGSELLLRVDSDVKNKPSNEYFKKNSIYNIIGGVSRYVDVYSENKLYFQIKITNNPLSSGDLVKVS